MTLRVDPERNEVSALKRVTEWRGKRVLEIGCGDGRLTRRLARLGAHVQAIDPDPALIRAARRQLPPSFSRQVTYRVGRAGRLVYAGGSFSVVLFSWSL
jgi:2-polyprenyl-3-methyl-5-hydroxy-6-metoxy-1,4-benzoquinol methylase